MATITIFTNRGYKGTTIKTVSRKVTYINNVPYIKLDGKTVMVEQETFNNKPVEGQYHLSLSV